MPPHRFHYLFPEDYADSDLAPGARLAGMRELGTTPFGVGLPLGGPSENPTWVPYDNHTIDSTPYMGQALFNSPDLVQIRLNVWHNNAPVQPIYQFMAQPINQVPAQPINQFSAQHINPFLAHPRNQLIGHHVPVVHPQVMELSSDESDEGELAEEDEEEEAENGQFGGKVHDWGYDEDDDVFGGEWSRFGTE